ncbi:MAG: sugar phosphate isomerase/epimerase [Firmicutes bacterium]|nr:sugar phosphate isomerase/epimerase [Bacillota bacterium]
MELGFFSPEISGRDVSEVFARARAYGFTEVQYDFLTSHREEMPAAFWADELQNIAAAAKEQGIRITAVNGTFNMVDSDTDRLAEYTRRFRLICEAAAYLNAPIVTLCTGSKSPLGMWRYSPDTAREEVFDELLRTTEKIMPYASEYGLIFGVETEASNVIFTAERCRRYLDTVGDPRLKVIMDCANLFPAGMARRENVDRTICNAFELLGKDIVLTHGKDVAESKSAESTAEGGSALSRTAFTDGKPAFASPGKGIVNYELFFELLKEIHYDGGLILHGIHDPADFEPCVEIIRGKMIKAGI